MCKKCQLQTRIVGAATERAVVKRTWCVQTAWHKISSTLTLLSAIGSLRLIRTIPLRTQGIWGRSMTPTTSVEHDLTRKVQHLELQLSEAHQREPATAAVLKVISRSARDRHR